MQTYLEPGGVDEREPRPQPKPDPNPQAESAVGRAPALPPRVVRDPVSQGV